MMSSVNKMLHMEESLSGLASWKFKENFSRCGKKKPQKNFQCHVVQISFDY